MTKTCPICASGNASQLHAATGVPVFMNRIYESAAEARAAATGRLEILTCLDCGFGWNDAFDASLITYDAAYENDQMHSPAFLAHVEARARDVIAAVPEGEPIDILEVGCGQGRFMIEVARLAGARLRSAEGFDPAWRGKDGEGPGRCRIHKVYFDDSTAGRLRFTPNVVVSRHTIEHIPNPRAFLGTVRSALGTVSRARMFLETPSLPWIVTHGAMQDLFYEHCSIFSDVAMTHALAASGFADCQVRHVFGDQYLWASATAAEPRSAPEPPRGHSTAANDRFARFVTHWHDRLETARANGPVVVWGAGAKGVTFCLLVDPDCVLVDHVVDINPAKQDHYLGGSGLRIVSPAESFSRAPRTIFVMNPNYLDEIASMVRTAGSGATLIAVE